MKLPSLLASGTVDKSQSEKDSERDEMLSIFLSRFLVHNPKQVIIDNDLRPQYNNDIIRLMEIKGYTVLSIAAAGSTDHFVYTTLMLFER